MRIRYSRPCHESGLGQHLFAATLEERQVRLSGAIFHWIGKPGLDSGIAPSDASMRDGHLAREASFKDLAIKGRAAEAGALEHGRKPDDPVWSGIAHRLLL
ncbi:MAG: hypothetical protein JWO25_3141 [Alphaproteobacteria bacterium]|nr:hypothetical protein [Alphaproteobacteria bacterium]